MVGTQGFDGERQVKEKWLHEFENPKQYVSLKVDMLMKDMYIQPTEEEIKHLNSLKTQGDIDRAVKTIIDRAWS